MVTGHGARLLVHCTLCLETIVPSRQYFIFVCVTCDIRSGTYRCRIRSTEVYTYCYAIQVLTKKLLFSYHPIIPAFLSTAILSTTVTLVHRGIQYTHLYAYLISDFIVRYPMMFSYFFHLTILSPLALGFSSPPVGFNRHGRRRGNSIIPPLLIAQLSQSQSHATPEFDQQQQQQQEQLDVRIASVATGQSLPGDKNNNKNKNNIEDDIISAAAAATLESCPLLGVKSLGVDYGLARTGIAVTVGYNPEPLHIIEQSDSLLLAQTICQIAAGQQHVSQIILGLPLHKNGTQAEQTILTRTFGRMLAQCSMATLGPHVSLYLFDERYTSKEAAARVHARDPKMPILYGSLDAESACIILETYYNDNGVGAERIQLTDAEQAPYLAEYQLRQEDGARQRQAVLDQREANRNKRQDAMERANKLEEEMRQAGTLGESNKSKKKKKKQQQQNNLTKKKDSTTWILP